MRHYLLAVTVLVPIACSSPRPLAEPQPVRVGHPRDDGQQMHGAIIPSSGGTPLVFCSSPGLSVTLKVDSVSVGATRLAMGTGEIAVGASNEGTHADVDEVTFFLDGSGRTFVGADTVDVRPGLVLYVPQGVRHGFRNTGAVPLRFAWVIVPQGLAERFRTRGVAPGTACPPARP